jgi:hypothetical protein
MKFARYLLASSEIFMMVFGFAPAHSFAQQALAAAAKAPLSAEEAARGAMPSNPAPATSTPFATDGHPDLTGLWSKFRGVVISQHGNTTSALQPTSRAPESTDPDNNLSVNVRITDAVAARKADPNKPAYKPELLAKVAELDRLEPKLDPGTHCKLPGIPRVGPPKQIVQGPGVVVFLYDDEAHTFFRVIPTNGHPHRTDAETNGLSPSYLGDSIGKWEGDTLAVDTVDFNNDTWLSIDGWFHSTALHVIERLRREGDALHYQATVEDPNVLTKPWVANPVTLKLNRTDARIEQEQPPCDERDTADIVTTDHH